MEAFTSMLLLYIYGVLEDVEEYEILLGYYNIYIKKLAKKITNSLLNFTIKNKRKEKEKFTTK